jgi:hypothetical protein
LTSFRIAGRGALSAAAFFFASRGASQRLFFVQLLMLVNPDQDVSSDASAGREVAIPPLPAVALLIEV